MRLLRFLRAAVLELVSLVVDDVLTLTGAAIGLVGMYVLGHHVAALRQAAGFVMYAVIWALLALSMARAARAARRG